MAQGVMLLLGAGNLDQLLMLLAKDAALTPEAHIMGDTAVCKRVDEELRSWWPSASPAISPIFLAFAAFLSLSASLQGVPLSLLTTFKKPSWSTNTMKHCPLHDGCTRLAACKFDNGMDCPQHFL